MGFCFLGGRENPLRKAIADKLTALGQAVNMGAMASAFTTAIQNIYDNRYTAGQDSLKTNRKLTLTSSQTGSNVDITDNWYTSVDASAVYTAGQNSLKVSRKLTLPAAATGTNYDITDNWYTTVDASAVYNAGNVAGRAKANILTVYNFGTNNKRLTATATIPSGSHTILYWSDTGTVGTAYMPTVTVSYGSTTLTFDPPSFPAGTTYKNTDETTASTYYVETPVNLSSDATVTITMTLTSNAGTPAIAAFI